MDAADRHPVSLAAGDIVWAVVIVILGGITLAGLLPLPVAAAGLFLTAMLAWLSLIDLRTRLLPNVLTIPLAAVGLALSSTSFGPGLLQSVMGTVAGYGIIALVALGYRRSRGVDGIGLGDAKLLAALGAWLGIGVLSQLILLAALGGLAAYAVRRRGVGLSLVHAIPFGPFLAAAGWASFVAAHAGLDTTGALASWLGAAF